MNTGSIDFHKICKESKELVQLTPESERLINKAGPIVMRLFAFKGVEKI